MAFNFTDIPFESGNLDRYHIRISILKALSENLKNFKKNLLDVGCGQMPYRSHILENSEVDQYTGLDIENALEYDSSIKPHYTWNGIIMPFKDESFETVIATEVLEHCPDPLVVFREINRVLKPGGVFFFTVPFLWNLHEVPHDEYRYTPFSLERLLNGAEFREIDIRATGGWHASMAQMLGLWVRRSPMKANKRRFLSKLLMPIIKKLIALDKPEQVQFTEGQMITGLYGFAKK